MALGLWSLWFKVQWAICGLMALWFKVQWAICGLMALCFKVHWAICGLMALCFKVHWAIYGLIEGDIEQKKLNFGYLWRVLQPWGVIKSFWNSFMVSNKVVRKLREWIKSKLSTATAQLLRCLVMTIERIVKFCSRNTSFFSGSMKFRSRNKSFFSGSIIIRSGTRVFFGSFIQP